MKYIVFSGIDGSGKSSIISGVREALEKDGIGASEQWLRFHHRLCRPLHAAARILGLARKREMTEGGQWRHEFYRSRWFCALYLRAAYLDTLWGKYTAVRRARRAGRAVVLCDRWIPDIVIDLAVKTRREDLLDGNWGRRFFRLLPRETLLLGIRRNRDALLACRAENREDPDFEFREKLYAEWIGRPGPVTIDNNHSLTDAIATANRAVRDFIEEKPGK